MLKIQLVNNSIMSDNTGARLRTIAVAFILMGIFIPALVATQPEMADARANLTAYENVPPTGWEPKGYNVNGSAPWLAVNTVGWNAVKIMGNVGLGNGSVRYLDANGNRDHHYADTYYMAGDISTAPIDIGCPGSSGADTHRAALNDPYHSILIGRPVDDLMYQYPLTPAITTYGRLAGLPMPGGSYANIGLRCLSYGY